MLADLAGTADETRLGAIRPDLPILIMSGTADPLAGGGDLIDLVAERYRKAGVDDVTVALYHDARHEVFNETNRDEVTADLITWLDRITAARAVAVGRSVVDLDEEVGAEREGSGNRGRSLDDSLEVVGGLHGPVDRRFSERSDERRHVM